MWIRASVLRAQQSPAFPCQQQFEAGDSLRNIGQIDAAAHLYRRAAGCYQEQDSLRDWLRAYLRISGILERQEDYLGARQLLDSALSKQFRPPLNKDEKLYVGWTYLNLAANTYNFGDHRQAIRDYEQAVALLREIDFNEETLARLAYMRLGNLYSMLGEHERARLYLEKSVDVFRAANKPSRLGTAYNDLGSMYVTRNEYDTALVIYEEGLAIPGLDARTKSLLNGNIANIHLNREAPAIALPYAHRALRQYQQDKLENAQDSSKVSEFMRLLGEIHTRLGHYEQAETFFRQAIAEDQRLSGSHIRRNRAVIHTAAGRLYLEQRDYRQADAQFRLALQALIPAFDAGTSEAPLPSADRFYPEVYIIQALDGLAQAYQLQAEFDPGANGLHQALHCYELISAAEDSLRLSYDMESSKLFVMDESHRRTETAIELAYRLFQQTKDTAFLKPAFHFAERSRALVLLESIRSTNAISLAEIPAQWQNRDRDYRSQIVYFEKKVRELPPQQDSLRRYYQDQLLGLRRGYRSFIDSLKQRFPDYERIRQDLPLVSAGDVQQKLLSPQSTLIEYFVGDSMLYAFTITQKQLMIRKLGAAATVKQQIPALRRAIQDGWRQTRDSTYSRLALALYNQLIAPLETADTLPSRLIIVPDGVLGYLPFDALLSAKPERPGDYKRYPYLLQRYRISYAYSATLLAQMREARHPVRRKHREFLGIAPTFRESSHQYSFLANSAREVESIAGLLGGGKVLLEKEATKQAFLDEVQRHYYRIIHFSTHAKMVDSIALNSHIVLYDGEQMAREEYQLSLSDLYLLRLFSELVVLGACETGSGQLSEGEGIISMARGFAYAGCRSLLTTLWEVSHQPTTNIMLSFYEGLSAGIPKDEALYQAKLAYLQSEETDRMGAHPYFWAAFTPIGDMQPVVSSPWPGLLRTGLFIVAIVFLAALIWYVYRRKMFA